MSELTEVQKNMVHEFQCPGCVCGLNTESGCYEADGAGFFCQKHCAGTIAGGIGVINLGLPKGFNRIAYNRDRPDLTEGDVQLTLADVKNKVDGSNVNNIRLFERPEDMPEYNFLNIPVWAYETVENGMEVLIVRCYMPRVNYDFVDVILGGSLDQVRKMYPACYDASEFISEID